MVSVSTLLLPNSGCKKCFHCYNECVSCNIADSTGARTVVLCNDSFHNQAEYTAAVSAITSSGNTCASVSSTYIYNFCVNRPGEKMYPDYFNKGNKIECNEK